MAFSVDYATRVITIPQADLVLVGGTFYQLDTDAFRLELKSFEDSELGIPLPDTHRHNTTVTVAGTTFARTIEIINGWSVEFEDGAYSVQLVGSNNNLFDIQGGVLIQNQVQVIPTNSAGLIVLPGGTAATPAEISDAVWDDTDPHNVPGSTGERLAEAAGLLESLAEAGLSVRQAIRLIAAASAGKLSGADGTTITIRSAVADDADRIVATVDVDGNRSAVTVDPGA